MIVTTYRSVDDFLDRTQDILVTNEAANGMMLGACLRLRKIADKIESDPYFVAVEDGQGLVLAALKAPSRKIIVYGHRGDCADAPLTVVRDLVRRKRGVPGVLGQTGVASAFALGWTELSGSDADEIVRRRVYQFTDGVRIKMPPGNLRAATEKDIELLTRWVDAYHRDLRGLVDPLLAHGIARALVAERDAFFWENGEPVSMAAKVRPTPNGVSVSYVYTPPLFRGRGYATACLGSLSRALLKLGWKFCVAHSSSNNSVYQRVLERVGYSVVSELSEYGFGPL